ncbi:MAG: autotransporter-associated beta strand repeat-containing protein, partial [Kiritimatiellaeota bacterium]|nr:autotransporter-associated beta strand repeat-containing protein [Kiritimatiellota bacterium]
GGASYTLTKPGAGTLTLSGSNSFGGGLTLNAGTLTIGNNNALGAGAVVINGGTVDDTTGFHTISGVTGYTFSNSFAMSTAHLVNLGTANVMLGANITVTMNTWGGTIGGNISDGGSNYSLTAAGAGTLVLSGTNSYGGGTTLSGGTLSIGNYTNLPYGGNLTFNGGILQIIGTTVNNLNPYNVNNSTFNGGLNIASGNTLTLTNVLGGSGSLTNVGAGTLILAGANTYTGGTVLKAGTLQLTLTFNGNNTILDLGGNSQTFSNLAFAAISQTNTIQGGGALTVNGTADFKSASATVTQVVSMANVNSFTYNSPTKVFSVGSQASGISGSYTLTLASTNTITALRFGVSDIYPNTANPSAGTIHLGQVNNINADTITISQGKATGTLDFTPGLTNPTLMLRGTNGTSSRVTTMLIGSNASSTSASSGTVNLTNVTGVSTFDALIGTLTLGSPSGSANANGTLLMGGGILDATTIILGQNAASSGGIGTGLISLNGGTVKVQTLTIGNTLGSVSSVGTFNLVSGTLLAANIQAGTGTATRAFNWTAGTISNYDASTDLTIGTNLTLNLIAGNNHIFNFDAGRTAIVFAVMTNNGNLVLSGAGTLVLVGANTYSGNTLLQAGTLVVSNALALQNSTFSNGNGTVQFGSGITGFTLGGLAGSQNIVMTDAGGVAISLTVGGNTSNTTFSGNLSDNSAGSSLIKNGTGTLTLSGSNSFSGLTLNTGGIVIGNNNALGAGTVVINGGTLDAVAATYAVSGITGYTVSNNFTLANAQAVNLGTAGVVLGANITVTNINIGTIGGTISDGGNNYSLTKAGLGTLVLSGSNSFGGGVILNVGTLRLDGTLDSAASTPVTLNPTPMNWNASFTFTGTSNLNLGAGPVTLTNSLTVTANANTLTVGGSITGLNNGVTLNALDITKAGTGTLALTAPITLRAVQTNTVSAGAEILAGAIDDGGGNYSLTVAGAGALALQGANTFGGGLMLNAGTLRIENAGALGSGTFTINAGTIDNASGAPVTNANGNPMIWASNFTFTGTASLNLGTGSVNQGTGTRSVTVNANTLTVGGAITNSGGLTKLGGGTLNLASDNTYSGVTTVSGGVLLLNSANALPGGIGTTGGSNLLRLAGGVIGLGAGNSPFTRYLLTGGNSGTNIIWTSDTLGGFAAFGSDATVNLGGADIPTTIQWSNSGGKLGAGLILGATNADATVNFINPIFWNTQGRTVQVDRGSAPIDGILSGTLDSSSSLYLNKTGNGILALTATNTYGITIISAGTLMIGTGGATGTLGTGSVTNN